ncbi:MAG: hypothetical protein KBC95_01310 [Candidatus Peribacteraceae bacterium]|nr:hypothetical protein [Candidatus Peribacteraceae bacterium]
MYEHFKEAEPGFIGGLVIPPSAEGVRKVYGKTREALIGWADGVPVLNLVGKAVRAII